ncbi:MAG: CvpA family protein [Rhodospirillales bacterium]|jgi:membrane protein required for colicin V production|nr:CvpA family protein [Rhodospirillales bacterium]
MDSLPINITDIAVVVVVLISALLAYARGFVHEVLSVLGWIGAVFATIHGLPYAKPYARELIPVELIADLAAGVTVFVVTLILLSFVTRGVAKMVKASALNFLDRSLGFLFGIVRGGVIICIMYIGLSWMVTPADQPSWVQNARSMDLIRPGADVLRALVPEDTAQAGSKAAKNVQKKAEIVIETQKVFRDMMTIRPETPKGSGADGYNSGERSEMERLIEGTK